MDVDEHDEELADVRVTTTVSADRQTPPPPPAAAAAAAAVRALSLGDITVMWMML